MEAVTKQNVSNMIFATHGHNLLGIVSELGVFVKDYDDSKLSISLPSKIVTYQDHLRQLATHQNGFPGSLSLRVECGL
jgi:hypothetical protein